MGEICSSGSTSVLNITTVVYSLAFKDKNNTAGVG